MKLHGLTMGNHFNASEINKNMGEKLVMHALMTYWDWDVEYVDYVGADLIAIDTHSENRQKYAISVKTKDLTRESQSISSFKDSDFAYLCKFASDMSRAGESAVIPLVAFVALTKSGHLYVMIINAYDFDDMRSEGILVQHSANGGYSFNIGTQKTKDNQEMIQKVLSDPRVSYIDMEINDIQKRDLSGNRTEAQQSLDTENWRNELGDFGEKLAVFLSNTKNRRAFHIKSVGADIIMMDLADKNKQYAVSVKTFLAPNDDYQFSAKDVEHLSEFAQKWGMQAEVALVALIPDKVGNLEKLYYFLVPLQYMSDYVKDHMFSGYITSRQEKQKNAQGFSWRDAYCITWKGDFFDKITKDPNISFVEMKF